MYSHNTESFCHGYLDKTVTETQPQANMNMNIVKIEALSTIGYLTPLHCVLPTALATTPTQYFCNCFMTEIKFRSQTLHGLHFKWLL